MVGQGFGTPGIHLQVEELVAVRERLAGVSAQKFRRRSSFRSGVRETRMKGRGMEYEESRAYVPGDDVRTMDWRVMARTGEAHTKIFAEEKERRFLLAIDLSASMYFGTRYSFKSWTAACAAAHIGWLASFHGDRLGGLIVSPHAHHEIRPGKTRTGLLALFHHLVETVNSLTPASGQSSRLNYLLRELMRVVKPGSVITLISDFIGADAEAFELIAALSKHNQLNAFWIYDNTEVNPWQVGRYSVILQREIVDFDITGNDDWLLSCQREHRSNIDTLISQLNIPVFPVSCNLETTPQILEFMEY